MIEPPAKRASSRLNNRHLPSELIEVILLKLPHKSLVRFSMVSKSWNSMIFNPEFARKHKNRAALLHWHRLVVYTNYYDAVNDPATALCFLAPISSNLRIKMKKRLGDGSCPSLSVFSNAKDDVFDFAGQFTRKPYLRACCDELWCVQVENSLFLWNPSMRNIVELPRPSSFRGVGYIYDSMYGLAYDSVNDDYKILKIRTYPTSTTELYSLKNNCWRKIKPVSYFITSKGRCEFVGGRFHWVVGARIIAYFDLSSEMYGEVALPHYDYGGFRRKLEVVALRGMLCASVNYSYFSGEEEEEEKGRFVLWVMEEYGLEKSWTKRFDFMIPRTELEDRCRNPEELIPLDLSDNNDILVKMHICCANEKYILMYKNGEARPTKIVIYEKWNDYYSYNDVFLYVQSLITHNNFSKKR